jgi:hypothetical protein
VRLRGEIAGVASTAIDIQNPARRDLRHASLLDAQARLGGTSRLAVTATLAGSAGGATQLSLQEGVTPGKAKLTFKASEATIAALPLGQAPRVTAQVRTSEGACFGAEFSTAIRNDPSSFTAKSD